MRILLVGEYSRLHNSLKEGLSTLGHEVLLVGTGDGFKQFPVDHNYNAKVFSAPLCKPFVSLIRRLTGFNLIQWERGYRFKKLLPKLKGFDVVQLINESPINTQAAPEIKLLDTLIKQNTHTFLLSCGTDYMSVSFANNKKLKYSILTPLHEHSKYKTQYQFILKYLDEAHFNLHQFLYSKIKGVIASDLDYHLPLIGHPKYLGLIPNPINTAEIGFLKISELEKIVIFHGINRTNYIKKGNRFFDAALEIIRSKYAEKVEIIIAEDMPYSDYIHAYDKAHIVLDQVYAYDQGYNALEAMAKGKVVFTGAETEWLEHYDLTEDTVAINAIPDAEAIASKLEWLLLHPEQILSISQNARAFIEKEHDHLKVANQYLDTWKMNE